MSQDPLEALIAYRLEQASEAIEEAQLMHDAGHLRATINRAYYAMFYAVQALLAKAGFSASKHSGAISVFNREFVKTGVFSKDLSRWLHNLFELRQDADYGGMFEASAKQASQALEQARTFVERVEAYLQK